MNRFIYFPIVLIVLLGFSACHKGSNTQNYPAMIVGKWNLQKDVYVQYADNVKKVDTTCIASDTLYSNVQFNADKTFTSSSALYSKSLNPSSPLYEASTNGTYTISGTSLTVSAGIGGIYFNPGGVQFTVLTGFTNYVLITQLKTLTANSMYIHTEEDVTATATNVSTNYKTTNDLYYTR